MGTSIGMPLRQNSIHKTYALGTENLQQANFFKDIAIKFLDCLIKLYIQVLLAWLMEHSGHNMGESVFIQKINEQFYITPSRTLGNCSQQGDNWLLSFLPTN